ncbi:hypothetical protein DMB66_32775 [Actinoplanes sp. ATCC 53533]|uniref:hypothetical protein n=1 Tax=Actinoplanes sp. ATCC 53533 TaxID=1288362 RepID=UPI000F7B5D98|nr:hypothetical protein [Actinoplanes sp. ATCC 53533]RSM56797.1 hypothetical protein DMB66_32775 [Actinoplanes sp. ATCC 53533]
MTAPTEPDTLTAVNAEPAREDPAHDRNHDPSMTDAPQSNAFRMHLRTAHGATAHSAVPILVRAFIRTPLARWLFPTVGERGNGLRTVFARLIDDTAGNGSVVLAYQGRTPVGAALWRTCPARDETDPAAPAFTLDDPGSARLTELADRHAHGHPPEPHECLLALAVVPGREWQGIAGTLLASTTTRPGTSRFVLTPGLVRDLLHQLGYQPCGEEITLPDDGPTLHPFWLAVPALQPKETKR